MVHGLYCVRDKVADAFIPPFLLPTDGMAVREFTHACQLPDHKFGIHADDYSLFKVGSFDDVTGVVTAFVEPLFLIAARNCVTKVKLPLEVPNGEKH